MRFICYHFNTGLIDRGSGVGLWVPGWPVWLFLVRLGPDPKSYEHCPMGRPTGSHDEYKHRCFPGCLAREI